MATTTSKAKTAAKKTTAAVKTVAKKTTTAAKTAVKKAPAAVKKAATAVKKDPVKAATTATKAVVGGVSGAVQTGISAAANSRLLKGTKLGTTVDLANSLYGVAGVWQDIGIDAVAALAVGVYKGKTVSELTDTVITAAKNSTKGNVDSIVDKSVACLKAYDKDFSKQDLAKFGNALKASAKAKMKK
jgi:hypothetical protein